jgi:predicted metal-dependent peptidase
MSQYDSKNNSDKENEAVQKMLKIADEILNIGKTSIIINLRFFDAALAELETEVAPISSMATDGKNLYYDPIYILKRYKEDPLSIPRDILHVLFHCLFRHGIGTKTVERKYWDMACDIAVENVIDELNLVFAEADRSQRQDSDIASFKRKVSVLTAEKIYEYLRNANVGDGELVRLKRNFYADSHDIWYMSPDQKAKALGKKPKAAPNDNSQGDDIDNVSFTNSGIPDYDIETVNERWKEISERMKEELESFSKQRGDTAGSLIFNIKEVNREKYDYTTFLKKFAVTGEAMKINDDEFDYVFYTYGLKLYDKMPLVEPLEYKEVKKIREFVIAIDTSGSVIGEEVQSFITKTFNILKSTESFFEKVNIRIIQCDTEIQSDDKITSLGEIDEYVRNMKIRGAGGTDFRPVFEYVNKLIKEKEFTNLKGLIYFTDGYGVFPKCMPDYKTAFVFVRGEVDPPDTPPWAIRLILDKEDL